MTDNRSRYARCWSAIAGGLLLLGQAGTSLPAEEVTIAYRGLNLNGNLERAGSRDLSDGVVLLVHGMLMHNRMEVIRQAQDLLTENGVNSLAINLSFSLDNRHGTYDCTVPHRYKMNDAVLEVAAWTDWLAAQGVDKVLYLGHSIAANFVLVSAVDSDRSALRGVVALAPNTSGYSALVAAYENRYKVRLAGVLSQAKSMVDAGAGADLMEVDFFFCPKARVSAETLLDWYKVNPIRNNLAGYLSRVRKPTLVIAASADERQPNVEAYVLGETDGKRVRLYVVENSGHFFRDLNMDDAMDAILPFIEEVF